MMGSKDDTRMDGGDVDRLSSLPDDLIHKIFSSFSTKFVVRTSLLSSRWRFIWTSIPCLNLSTDQDFYQFFTKEPKFSEFVKYFLSRRNSEIEVLFVRLILGEKVSQGFVKEIMDYVFSHNIEQLNLSYRIKDRGSKIPRSLDSFWSLQYPSLSNGMNTSRFDELPALTTLYLHLVDWSTDNHITCLFSKCANLRNLILESCAIEKQFSICHPRLSNLTLDDNSQGKYSINVVAPKLQNLTIRNREYKKHHIQISAPDLTSFVYEGIDYHSLRLSTDGFNSLKEADICISKPMYGHFGHILGLLEHLHNVKFLTLNMEILEHLSTRVEQMLHKPFVFTNLKRIRIRPQSESSQSYYFNSFPGATLEEIVAQNILVELRVLLEQEKADIKTSMTQMERGKDPMESHGSNMCRQGNSQTKTKFQIEKSVTEKIESCLEGFCVQIGQTRSRYRPIISKLKKIDKLFAKLPASRTALIQPSLASLSAEAVIVMDGITGLMKPLCKENKSQISGCLQELATAWKPSY